MNRSQRLLKILTVAPLVLGAGAIPLACGSDDSDRGSDEPAKSVAVGHPLNLDGMTYRVTRADSARSVSIAGTPYESRRGRVVAIRLEARNRQGPKGRVVTMGTGDVPREWVPIAAPDVDEVALIGGNDKPYATPYGDFFKASVRETHRGASFLKRNFGATLVRRRRTQAGWLYYDVPARAVPGARLIVRRSTDGTVLTGYVRLGLPNDR